MDYNTTLNLPKTDFPMRASLPTREPGLLSHLEEVYGLLMEQNKDKTPFILHDGPPFSNANIHIGTAFNKILKDFIIRFQNMAGRYAPYVPGWDNHGLPIESAINKKQRLDRKNISPVEFRDACRDFAAHWVDVHREQFKRLGVLGDWEHPYLTMDPAFEAAELDVFGKMYEKGLLYKGLKPVYWCTHDKTALAEAEIEYKDAPCDSIYVKFGVLDDKGKLSDYHPPGRCHFVIWTTTTWTLPGNVAICLHPDLPYALVKSGDDCYIVADALREQLCQRFGWDDAETLVTLKGHELEFITTRHPFLDRESLVITGLHVTAENGTGCVHTAPGHGVEDYNACLRYQLPGPVPVDAAGIMTEEAGAICAGQRYNIANESILAYLRENGALLAVQSVEHSYPHCWRCGTPIIFRATPQWFAGVKDIRGAACDAVKQVSFIPSWGRERMLSMIGERADWCISRQRSWGLPIPVFYCGDCEKPICTPETIAHLAGLFSQEGSNVWWKQEAAALLPPDFACPHCGKNNGFTKEKDTLDGWFDSGSTQAAVLRKRPELRWPADLYLEGPDQFRGWYQSSLLTAIATTGESPFRTVLTHGWTVDGEGRKMSKSLGNGVDPMEVCKQNGADILRLWVSSCDFHSDVRISPAMLKQLGDVYLKIRNTCRFLLSNLYDFDPANAVTPDALGDLDLWAMSRLDALTATVRSAYERYEFHPVLHAIHNFCVQEMSNFYLDVVKDALYCEKADSGIRRGIQSTLYRILDTLVRLAAPILAFTGEEIWAAMPHAHGVPTKSPLLAGFPEPYGFPREQGVTDEIYTVRPLVNKALEEARNQKRIGKPLEAAVTLTLPPSLYTALQHHGDTLRDACIVSSLTLREGSEAVVEVARISGEKCERCWRYVPDVGAHGEHSTLCGRCAAVVS